MPKQSSYECGRCGYTPDWNELNEGTCPNCREDRRAIRDELKAELATLPLGATVHVWTERKQERVFEADVIDGEGKLKFRSESDVLLGVDEVAWFAAWEATHGGRYWGCVDENGEWVGQNKLGKLLMQVREELR